MSKYSQSEVREKIPMDKLDNTVRQQVTTECTTVNMRTEGTPPLSGKDWDFSSPLTEKGR